MTAAQAYAAAVDALQAARKRQREIRRACECYEKAEEGDRVTGYPGSDERPPCPWSKQPREHWCETCAALTDIPRLGTYKAAVKSALREVLRAGRRPGAPEGDSITRTSIALVEAREEVKRLRTERATCICDFEARPNAEPWKDDLPPLRTRGREWDRIETAGRKRVPAKTAPCWAVIEADDAPSTEFGRVPQFEQIGDSDGFCPSCERRQVLHEQLRAARRRVVALTSGHLAATKAHMRRIGRLPPAEKREPGPSVEERTEARLYRLGDAAESQRPPSSAPWQEDPNDVPF